jgi:cytochrome c oxidase cbb3-type subunit III
MLRAAAAVLTAAAVLGLGIACDRDSRLIRRQSPPAGQPGGGVIQIPLEPGVPAPRPPVQNPYEGDNRALEEGARLYDWYNCSGCHFAGGGGIGPPLMDGDWVYGGEPHQIYDSIASGRANGMPAYGAKVPAQQIWFIVAYVQSLDEDAEERRRMGAPEDPRQHER